MTPTDQTDTTDQPSPSIAVEVAQQRAFNALARLNAITPSDSPAAPVLAELLAAYADARYHQAAALRRLTDVLADRVAMRTSQMRPPLASPAAADVVQMVGVYLSHYVINPPAIVDTFARFAVELQGIRHVLGISPDELAERSRTLDAQTITGIESGAHVPTFSQMVELLGALGYGFIIAPGEYPE